MLYNKNVVYEKAITNTKNKIFGAIVTETFVNALPFDEDTFTLDMKKDCGKFMMAVVESLGGTIVLENSIVRATDFQKKYLLTEISEICTRGGEYASSRLMKSMNEGVFEAKIDDGANVKSGADIAAKATISKEESAILKADIKTLDIDKISEIIQDKVVKTIKDEKAAYENEENIKAKIEEQLQDSDDEETKTYESYVQTMYGSNAFVGHCSLFNTVQHIVTEGLLFNNSNEELLNMNITKPILLEVLGIDKSRYSSENLDTAIESLISFNHSDEINQDTEELMNKSLTNTILIHTALETLNTLNLIDLQRDNIQEFVENNKVSKNMLHDKKEVVLERLNTYIGNMKSNIYKTANLEELGDCKAALETKSEVLAGSEIFKDQKQKIDGLLTDISKKITVVQESMKTTVIDPENMNKLRDVAELSKINSLVARKATVDKIVFSPVNESMMDVCGYDAKGDRVSKSFINISLAYESFNLSNEQYLKKIISESDLKDTTKIMIFKKSGAQELNLK